MKASGFLGFLVLTLAACAGTPPGPEGDLGKNPSGLNPLPAWVSEGPIYEINLRSFTPEGTFSAAAKKLPEIQALGVKTIWLEPFSPMGKAFSTPVGSLYCQKDKRGVDPRFGTLEDFHNFRDQAHGLGMKVIVDVALFHTSWDHPWIQEHPDWYQRNEDGSIQIFREMYQDIAALRQDLPQVRKAMADLLLYWIRDQGLDGFRLDSATGVTPDFWTEALPQVYALKPVLFLAELDAECEVPEGPNLVYFYGNTLLRYWNKPYAEWLIQDMKNQLIDSRGVPHMKFLAFHDEKKELSPENLYAPGLEGAAVLTFTLPGIPRLLAGNEVGSKSEGSVTQVWKIDWTEKPGRREFYTKIFALWKASRVLREGTLIPREEPQIPGLIAFERRFQNQSVKVLVNTTGKSLEYQLPEPWTEAGTKDLWTQEPWTQGSRVKLEPFGWRLLGTP